MVSKLSQGVSLLSGSLKSIIEKTPLTFRIVAVKRCTLKGRYDYMIFLLHFVHQKKIDQIEKVTLKLRAFKDEKKPIM